MNRRGVALLEAVVALVVLTSAGTVSLTYLTALGDALDAAIRREHVTMTAERVLVATSLLTGSELTQRLGVREVGTFLVWVDRPERDLFRIGVSHRDLPQREIISTLIHVASTAEEVADEG